MANIYVLLRKKKKGLWILKANLCIVILRWYFVQDEPSQSRDCVDYRERECVCVCGRARMHGRVVVEEDRFWEVSESCLLFVEGIFTGKMMMS